MKNVLSLRPLYLFEVEIAKKSAERFGGVEKKQYLCRQKIITAGYFVSMGHPNPRSKVVCCLLLVIYSIRFL